MPKDYDAFSSSQLHDLVEHVVVQLNAFDMEYPEFMKQVVQGILEHPLLAKSDKATLKTYMTMFKFELTDKEDFLYKAPVRQEGTKVEDGEISIEQVKKELNLRTRIMLMHFIKGAKTNLS